MGFFSWLSSYGMDLRHFYHPGYTHSPTYQCPSSMQYTEWNTIHSRCTLSREEYSRTITSLLLKAILLLRQTNIAILYKALSFIKYYNTALLSFQVTKMSRISFQTNCLVMSSPFCKTDYFELTFKILPLFLFKLILLDLAQYYSSLSRSLWILTFVTCYLSYLLYQNVTIWKLDKHVIYDFIKVTRENAKESRVTHISRTLNFTFLPTINDY